MSSFFEAIKQQSEQKPVEQQSPERRVDPNQLTPQEIQFAIFLLKQSTIKGEQVEMFYNMIVKLQNQFIAQQNQ